MNYCHTLNSRSWSAPGPFSFPIKRHKYVVMLPRLFRKGDEVTGRFRKGIVTTFACGLEMEREKFMFTAKTPLLLLYYYSGICHANLATLS